MRKSRVSVLMPTCNDAKFISGAIKSVLSQSYENWELIIVDDGSTDDTPLILERFVDSRIVHLKQDNRGQLNALLTGAQSIQGNYVTILHSDDELSDRKAFERNVSELEKCECEGVFCDLQTMDENGAFQGRTRTVKYLTTASPAMLFLRGGSNIIPDIFFVKKESFENVLVNYVTWNMPYWLKFDDYRVGHMALEKVEPWYKYRVYPENYIRSEVGKFEAVHGCLRTVVEIGRRLNVPLAGVQRLLVRLTSARVKPIFEFKQSSPRNLREAVGYVLRRYYEKVPDNIYFKGLAGFYANFPSNRIIDLPFKEDDKTFLGKDARIFHDLMEKKQIPLVYTCLLEESVNGFGKIVVNDKKSGERAKNALRFLNLLVEIEVR